MLVDVHAHIDFPEYDADRDEMLKRCEEKGIKAIINNAVTLKSMQEILELSKKHPLVKPAFGIYPVHTIEYSEQEFENALDWIKANKPVAIGEIGLDYQEVEEADRALMEERFVMQIKLAKELDLPVIVHSRKAEERTIEVLEEQKAKKVVMHCFSGKKKLVKRIIENKWKLSIPANIIRAEQFKMIVVEAPVSQLLTETDSPFLPPTPGDRNEPWQVQESINQIALIKKLEVEETKKLIFNNYQEYFL